MYKILTLLFLITCLSAKAQKPISITVDATYFDPASLKFYKPQDNGTCLVYDIDTRFDPDTGNFTSTLSGAQTVSLEKYLKMQGTPMADLVLLSGMKKGKTGYDKRMEELSYRSLPETDEYTNQFDAFYVANPHYFMFIGYYGTKNEDGTYTYNYNTDYYRFATVVVNNTFTLYIARGGDSHLVQYNNEFSFYIGEEYKKLQNTQRNQSFTDMLRETYPTGEKFTYKGKTGLMAYESSKILLPAEYDSLFNEWTTFVVAYKKGKPSVFYRNGEPVKLKGLRAVHIGLDLSVLTGNRVSWLSPNGNLTDSIPPQFVCGGVSFEMEKILKKDGNYVFSKHVMEPYNEPETREWVLAPEAAFTQVSLIMGQARIDTFSRYILAETPDGKKGIISTDENGYKTLLDFDYQEITGYFSNILRMDARNGLSGYFPLNKKARYTQLAEFEKGFARFTLPNGKQGWLALDGKEYIDE